MAVLYTRKQIQDALRELAIRPVNGNVSTKEAARILSWRAKHEEGIEHDYPESAVRRHVESKNLKVAEQKNKRFNLFKAEDVFELPLVPKRGIAQQKRADENAA